MKVLHVIPTLASGGAEKILVDIVEEAQKKGIQCEVVVFSKKEAFFLNQLEQLGVKIYLLGEKVYNLKYILELKKIIQLNKYDIIHTHLFSAQLFTPWALMLTKLKTPLVTTEHSTHNKRREKWFFKPVDIYMYAQYKKVIAITEAAKKALNLYLPSTLDKTVVIENGIKLDFYSQAVPINKSDIVTNYKNDQVIIVMVASLRKEKDHPTLIKAMKLLPLNYRLVIVGDGPLRDDLENLVKQLELEQRVDFLGKRKDIANLLKACDIFVLSSNWEGFGLVAVEAAASGLPVIASNVEGLNQVVKNIDGRLFDKGDIQGLAYNINQIDFSKRQNISSLDRYSIKKTVKLYHDIYNEVLIESIK